MKRQLQLKAILLILLCGQIANADAGWARIPKKIKVAVIDTGIDEQLLKGNSYCSEGHKDFTDTGLKDNHGHGTHISGIVDQYAKNYIFKGGKRPSDIDKLQENYCQIIIKYYDPHQGMWADNLRQTIKSFKWAIEQKVDIINYSGGGTDFSQDEKQVIEEALSKGIKVVVAAGNEHCDLKGDCNEYERDGDIVLKDKKGKPILKKKRANTYYPALYDDRIYVVGNLVGPDRKIASTSNYGDAVKYWEIGTNVLSRLPNMSYGYMTGTSQATAIKTGKLVREMLANP